jgi:hypothetical protein
MAEPNTSATLSYLRDKVARYLGIGAYSALSAGEQGRVDDIVRRGCRRFWFPPVLPGEAISHEWSFLKPLLTVTTAAGTSSYDLPDNWQGALNNFTYHDGQHDGQMINIIGDLEFRRLVGDNSETGPPRVAVIYQKDPFTGATGQRWRVQFFPKPDAVYSLLVRYQATPEVPSTGSNFFVGGPMFSETLLEACLSVAELEERDENGPHFGAFIESLRASVARDRQMSTPPSLGMMRMDHEGPPVIPRARLRTNSVVVYDGVIY